MAEETKKPSKIPGPNTGLGKTPSVRTERKDARQGAKRTTQQLLSTLGGEDAKSRGSMLPVGMIDQEMTNLEQTPYVPRFDGDYEIPDDFDFGCFVMQEGLGEPSLAKMVTGRDFSVTGLPGNDILAQLGDLSLDPLPKERFINAHMARSEVELLFGHETQQPVTDPELAQHRMVLHQQGMNLDIMQIEGKPEEGLYLRYWSTSDPAAGPQSILVGSSNFIAFGLNCARKIACLVAESATKELKLASARGQYDRLSSTQNNRDELIDVLQDRIQAGKVERHELYLQNQALLLENGKLQRKMANPSKAWNEEVEQLRATLEVHKLGPKNALDREFSRVYDNPTLVTASLLGEKEKKDFEMMQFWVKEVRDRMVKIERCRLCGLPFHTSYSCWITNAMFQIARKMGEEAKRQFRMYHTACREEDKAIKAKMKADAAAYVIQGKAIVSLLDQQAKPAAEVELSDTEKDDNFSGVEGLVKEGVLKMHQAEAVELEKFFKVGGVGHGVARIAGRRVQEIGAGNIADAEEAKAAITHALVGQKRSYQTFSANALQDSISSGHMDQSMLRATLSAADELKANKRRKGYKKEEDVGQRAMGDEALNDMGD